MDGRLRKWNLRHILFCKSRQQYRRFNSCRCVFYIHPHNGRDFSKRLRRINDAASSLKSNFPLVDGPSSMIINLSSHSILNIYEFNFNFKLCFGGFLRLAASRTFSHKAHLVIMMLASNSHQYLWINLSMHQNGWRDCRVNHDYRRTIILFSSTCFH